MVRKPQILMQFGEAGIHAALSGFTWILCSLALSTLVSLTSAAVAAILFPIVRSLFDEYSFIRIAKSSFTQFLREYLYAILASLPFLFSHPADSYSIAVTYASILSFLTITLHALRHTLAAHVYNAFPTFRIQLIFTGPAAVAEKVLHQINIRHLGHLFHTIGYVDYKSMESSIPNLGKFTDLESILDTHKPQILINTGRNEQHATLSYVATVRGIQYFSLPENIHWDLYQESFHGPFHLPLIEHTASSLTYWSYAIKRATDITIASVALILFSIPFALKRFSDASKNQLIERIPFTDPRNGNLHTLLHVGPLEEVPTWKSIPLFVNVLRNDLSLVGVHPNLAKTDKHFDLKGGVFPITLSPDSHQREIDILTHIRMWSWTHECAVIAKGLRNIVKSFFAKG